MEETVAWSVFFSISILSRSKSSGNTGRLDRSNVIDNNISSLTQINRTRKEKSETCMCESDPSLQCKSFWEFHWIGWQTIRVGQQWRLHVGLAETIWIQFQWALIPLIDEVHILTINEMLQTELVLVHYSFVHWLYSKSEFSKKNI